MSAHDTVPGHSPSISALIASITPNLLRDLLASALLSLPSWFNGMEPSQPNKEPKKIKQLI
jgi:hypothetical protein